MIATARESCDSQSVATPAQSVEIAGWFLDYAMRIRDRSFLAGVARKFTDGRCTGELRELSCSARELLDFDKFSLACLDRAAVAVAFAAPEEWRKIVSTAVDYFEGLTADHLLARNRSVSEAVK